MTQMDRIHCHNSLDAVAIHIHLESIRGNQRRLDVSLEYPAAKILKISFTARYFSNYSNTYCGTIGSDPFV